VPDGEETADRQITGAALGDDVDAPWAPSSQVTVTLAQDEYMQLLDRVDRTEGRPSSLSSPSALLEGPGAQEHEPADDEDAPFAPVSTAPPSTQQLADLELADEEPSDADATTDPAQLDSPTVDQSGQLRGSSAPADSAAHAFDPDPTFEQLALGSAGTVPARPLGAAPGSAAIDTPPIRPARRRGRHLTDVGPEHAAQRRPGQRRIATSVLFSRVRSPRRVAAGAVVGLSVLVLASIVGVVGGDGRAPAAGAQAVTGAASIGAKPVVETKRTPAPAITTRKRHKQAAHRTHRRSEHRHQQSTPQRRLRTHAASPVHYAVAASTTTPPTTAPTQTAPTQTTPTAATPTVTAPAPAAPAAPSSPSSPGPSSGSGSSSSSGTRGAAPAKRPAFGLGGELGPGHSPNS